jgi:hypothetical protein
MKCDPNNESSDLSVSRVILKRNENSEYRYVFLRMKESLPMNPSADISSHQTKLIYLKNIQYLAIPEVIFNYLSA